MLNHRKSLIYSILYNQWGGVKLAFLFRYVFIRPGRSVTTFQARMFFYSSHL